MFLVLTHPLILTPKLYRGIICYANCYGSEVGCWKEKSKYDGKNKGKGERLKTEKKAGLRIRIQPLRKTTRRPCIDITVLFRCSDCDRYPQYEECGTFKPVLMLVFLYINVYFLWEVGREGELNQTNVLTPQTFLLSPSPIPNP